MNHDLFLPALVLMLAVLAVFGLSASGEPAPEVTAYAVDASARPFAPSGQEATMVAAAGFPGDCSQTPGSAVECLYY